MTTLGMSVAETTTARITKRLVDGVAAPATGESRIWDAEIKGFFLRVYPTGRRVYALSYPQRASRRTLTIGVHGSPWTPEQARHRAREALEAIRRGEDPAQAKRETRAALTIKELVRAYLADGPDTKPGKRASTWAIDESNLRCHIEPLLGSRPATAVSKEDAARAITAIAAGKTASVPTKSGRKRGRVAVRGGEGTARRTRITAAAMYAWGLEHGRIKGENPFARIKLASPPTRERFLSQKEALRLLKVLHEMEGEGSLNPTFGDAIRLLLLTGARKTEVLGLKWREVDLQRKILMLPPERTKAGGVTGTRRIVLSPPAVALLKRRRKGEGVSETFVFPAQSNSGHAVAIRRPFVAACTRAGLTGIRIHDLRHTFASFAVADGASLFLVGKLLGHASSRTTERYAHLSNHPLQHAAAAVGRALMGGPAQPV